VGQVERVEVEMVAIPQALRELVVTLVLQILAAAEVVVLVLVAPAAQADPVLLS
jgi:hypothetical protein